MKNTTIPKIIKQIQTKGIEFLLPQNLTKDILDILLSEASLDTTYSFDNNESINTLVFVVLSLKHKKIFDFNNNDISVALQYSDEIINDIETYISLLALEDLQRTNSIKLSKSSLATMENVFISKRDIALENINE